MQSVESSSPRNARAGTAALGSKVTFAVMVTVLLVAVVFAANQNDIIGWLVVAISAGWLILSIVVVLSLRRGAQAVSQQVQTMNANLAPRAGSGGGTQVVNDSVDPMRDTKLDHSFKIVQVQARVITTELKEGSEADQEMVLRALDTIQMTAANARDMLKQSQDDDTDGPVSGQIID